MVWLAVWLQKIALASIGQMMKTQMVKIACIVLVLCMWLPGFSQIKVSVIGASVAAGYGVAGNESYPSQMGLILGSNWNVGNFGSSGTTLIAGTSYPYINQSQYPASKNFNPNIVTIELGSNDSKPDNWQYKDAFISDYNNLINIYKSLPSHPTIYICLPVPVYSNNFGISDDVITNEIIPKIRAIAVNNNVGLIDLNTPLKNHADWYQSDGIHPNATGARKIAEIISAAISPQQPYGGTPWPIPGTIQAENYDDGGEGVAYHDNDIINSGGQQRTGQGVDVENTGDATGLYDVGWTNSGEWMEYTVNVATTSSYTIQARVASPGDGNRLHVELDGVTISGSMTVPNTGGWQVYQTVLAATPVLTNGLHIVRIYEETGGFNINSISFITAAQLPVITSAATATGNAGSAFSYSITATNNPTSYAATGLPTGLSVNVSTGIISGIPTTAATYTVSISATNAAGTVSKNIGLTIGNSSGSTPYQGTPWPIPGTIQAENYDDGGEGIAYHDNDAINSGGQQRINQGVDVENTGDASGTYNIGWTASGEWLKYTVNVTTTGVYTLQARVASPNSNKMMHVEIDGSAVATVAVPNTTGWQIYQTVSVNISSITAGNHVLRIYMDTDGFNLNYITFVSANSPSITSSINATATLGSIFSYSITATNTPTGYSATGLPAGLSINTSTGVISGTPVNSGTSMVTIQATNAMGTGSATLALSVSTANDPAGVITCYKVQNVIAINGNLSEAGWNITRSFSKTVFGTPNNSATFGVLWDNTNLYIGVKVLDANLFADSPDWWEDDAVEIYLDPNNNKLSTYDGFDNQIIKGYNKSGISTKLNVSGLQHAWATVSGGYSIELAIPWSQLGINIPAAGTSIGFDISYNDDDNGGSREGQAVWNGTIDNWQNTSGFGRLTLNSGNASKLSSDEVFTSDEQTANVYPNPIVSGTSAFVTVPMDWTDDIELRVLNSSGEIVKRDTKKIVSNQFEFNTKDLTPGIYFLQMRNGDETQNEKIMVQ
ncbi:MAG: Carbohydrate-binding family 9 [Chitinophagaceae bacterium]|nr:Carbohydrate-binding family 9 [Chitinophagaceae bacterium]